MSVNDSVSLYIQRPSQHSVIPNPPDLKNHVLKNETYHTRGDASFRCRLCRAICHLGR